MQTVQLPQEVAVDFSLKKDVQIVAVRGFGEVDFTKITKERAEKLIAKTGNKYLEAKNAIKKTEPIKS